MKSTLSDQTAALLESFGVPRAEFTSGEMDIASPLTGETIARLASDTTAACDEAIDAAVDAFNRWRLVPAPRRGELVRRLGNALRNDKDALGRLVTIETGKVLSEGLGEVQEMIDICDFAVGLSRQLYGLTFPSERSEHRLMEQWHPIGPVAIISAFNFPVAVWCWNAALALVCGNSILWKPSEKTPLSALAVQALFDRVAAEIGEEAPTGLSQILIGGSAIGEQLARDRRVAVVSATGSTRMGRAVGEVVASRFGRSILELGGNNAAIVMPSADLELTLRAVAFASLGTAGQRCTSLRRLIVHSSIYDALIERLRNVYSRVVVGNPLSEDVLVGPLIDGAAFASMKVALDQARAEGGRVHFGERLSVGNDAAFYVRPALVELDRQSGPALEETFAPILYVLRCETIEEAIALQNDVMQGLSSAIFSTDMREIELFLSARGSDCGIANVNMGPSGAEIGGAFGGEKETGGGRESGSDSWKAYMRRQTCAINYGSSLPLAQGVRFDVM